MNYEKMARGMRLERFVNLYDFNNQELNFFFLFTSYSRREGFFKKLDKEKNKPNEYGKQLVFQFSEKVMNNYQWKWSFKI